MRKLILTRGHPGSGKSTAISQLGLRHWALSADAVRGMVAAPFITPDGRMIVNQQYNDVVFPMMRDLAGARMDRGETLVIDYSLTERGDLKNWLRMARDYRYEVAVLDMSTTPLDVALARNSKREEFDRVPDYRIEEMYDTIRANPLDLPGDVLLVEGSDEGAHVDTLREWLVEPVLDLSAYERVVHVGDLQGCYTVLAGPEGPLRDGLRDDTAYIFIGDLLDRGIENGKVMRWFLDEALGRDNVFLLRGNHEKHLDLWALGRPAVSNEFLHRTLPQLKQAGITHDDADHVVAMARDVLRYTYRGQEVFVCHAGLSVVPEELHLVSTEQYTKGTGGWGDPVDQRFEDNSNGIVQVHGHRNHGDVPVRATPHSFNLEDSVEHGGCLRLCTLSPDGWETAEYPNSIFRPLRERIALETVMSPHRVSNRKRLPHWMLDGKERSTVFDSSLLVAMKAHEGVVERTSERAPHVTALNFTKKVFFDKSWDDVVVKARGLFLDGETARIVARGYEKFWNIGEREETSLATLERELTFPVQAYVKENGFLGNIGYDARTDSLFIASKSTPDGKFADWFRAIVDATLTPRQQERLRRYLRDTESSMTFEVIDPENDPHMIGYDSPRMILLDILYRGTQFEKASFDVLKVVAEDFGLEHKRAAMRFNSFAQFQGWITKACSDLDYRIGGKHVEGVVLEDANGRMDKLKFPYYAFWKAMRTQKDRILSCRVKDKPYSFHGLRVREGEAPDPRREAMAQAFIAWCQDQPDTLLARDIITLREAFGRDFGVTVDEEPVAMASGMGR